MRYSSVHYSWNADALRHTQFEAKSHVAYDGAASRAYATMTHRPGFANNAEEGARRSRLRLNIPSALRTLQQSIIAK